MIIVLVLFAIARFVGRDRSAATRRTPGAAPAAPSFDDILDALPPPGAPIVARQEGTSP